MGISNSENPFDAAFAAAQAQSDLNAFITIGDDGEIGSGVLAGMQIAVKDNIHVAGMPNTAGTLLLNDFVPSRDAEVIARLKAAGARIFGKTNMHEMAFGVTSNNAHFGAVRNPYDTAKFAGGSSGGSAAAVAARIVPAALGTDTGGSMRIPASHCGVIGFRPSTGRYPIHGTTPVSHTRDTIGPMALSMAHIAALDRVMAAKDYVLETVDLGSLRLGLARDPFFQNLNTETARVTENALSVLSDAGVTIVEAPMTGMTELTQRASFPIALYEAARNLPKYLVTQEIDFTFEDLANGIEGPDVKALFAELARNDCGDGKNLGAVPEQVYQSALLARLQMQNLYSDYFASRTLDAIIFPTTILPAANIEGTVDTVAHNGAQAPTFATYVQNTDPGSVAGVPGLTLPAGLTKNGLPVGLALDAARGGDERLLAIGLAIEAILEPLPPPNAG
ncbi:MAG: amidase family protein [Erythrobacter sp.]